MTTGMVSGYLCNDPMEVQTTDGKTVSKFDIIFRNYDEVTTVFNVTVRGDYARFCQECLQKDDYVILNGDIDVEKNLSGGKNRYRVVSDFVKCMKFQDCVVASHPAGLFR